MSMHFWRFFSHFLDFFCIFWVNWTTERSPSLKNNSKKFLVQVAPEPPTVEMLRDLVLTFIVHKKYNKSVSECVHAKWPRPKEFSLSLSVSSSLSPALAFQYGMF